MTNNQTFTPVRVVILALLAMVASVGLLSAGDFSGTFTLPIEVRWGRATLPPGDYAFKINPGIAPYMAKVTGKNGVVYVLPASMDDRKFSGHSSLVLVRRGRTGVVRELHLAIPGLKPSFSREDVRVYDRGNLVSDVATQTPNQGGIALIYSAPKDEPPMVAQTPALIQRIPILMASK